MNETSSAPSPSTRPSSVPPAGGPSSRPGDWRRREIRLALVNTVKLGGSMLITWTIALVGRLYVPRFLGPDLFGILNFADAFCGTAFVALGLGLDTYVRREISVRPKHASDFMGGILVLRLALLAIVFAGVEIVLRVTHRPPEVKQVVYIYGFVNFFIADSTTTAGLLQAVGKVNGQSILSIFVKVGWMICTFVAVFLRLGVWAFAMALMLTEGAKALALFVMARRELHFSMRVQTKQTWIVLLASLPFFVSGLASTIYGRIGVSILAFMTNDREVGWFGAASGLQGMTLMLVPIVSWVLTPLFARAAASSVDELYSVVRSSFFMILALAIPLALMMLVGADYWVTLAFGAAYAPAAKSLEALAVATPLMYTSMLAAYALVALNQSWRMSIVFVSGILVSPIANLLLIRPLAQRLGPGGSGAGCALSVLITELGIATPLAFMLGARCFDRDLVTKLTKSMLAAAGVVALDRLVLRPFGPIRLVADAVLYVVAVLTTGAFDIGATLASLKAARRGSHDSVRPRP
jgi:O-antigen/teichoic acid export membrane protein